MDPDRPIQIVMGSFNTSPTDGSVGLNGYRYRLERSGLGGGDRCLTFIMLNPSTADEHSDDPTIRRCVGFARREGCSTLRVVNLFGYRATKPADLWAAREQGVDVVGAGNLVELEAAAADARTGRTRVVAAWGAHAAISARWAVEVARLFTGSDLWCLGVTHAGHPRHPLYVRNDQPLIRWNPKGTQADLLEQLNDLTTQAKERTND